MITWIKHYQHLLLIGLSLSLASLAISQNWHLGLSFPLIALGAIVWIRFFEQRFAAIPVLQDRVKANTLRIFDQKIRRPLASFFPINFRDLLILQ